MFSLLSLVACGGSAGSQSDNDTDPNIPRIIFEQRQSLSSVPIDSEFAITATMVDGDGNFPSESLSGIVLTLNQQGTPVFTSSSMTKSVSNPDQYTFVFKTGFAAHAESRDYVVQFRDLGNLEVLTDADNNKVVVPEDVIYRFAIMDTIAPTVSIDTTNLPSQITPETQFDLDITIEDSTELRSDLSLSKSMFVLVSEDRLITLQAERITEFTEPGAVASAKQYRITFNSGRDLFSTKVFHLELTRAGADKIADAAGNALPVGKIGEAFSQELAVVTTSEAPQIKTGWIIPRQAGQLGINTAFTLSVTLTDNKDFTAPPPFSVEQFVLVGTQGHKLAAQSLSLLAHSTPRVKFYDLVFDSGSQPVGLQDYVLAIRDQHYIRDRDRNPATLLPREYSFEVMALGEAAPVLTFSAIGPMTDRAHTLGAGTEVTVTATLRDDAPFSQPPVLKAEHFKLVGEDAREFTVQSLQRVTPSSSDKSYAYDIVFLMPDRAVPLQNYELQALGLTTVVDANGFEPRIPVGANEFAFAVREHFFGVTSKLDEYIQVVPDNTVELTVTLENIHGFKSGQEFVSSHFVLAYNNLELEPNVVESLSAVDGMAGSQTARQSVTYKLTFSYTPSEAVSLRGYDLRTKDVSTILDFQDNPLLDEISLGSGRMAMDLTAPAFESFTDVALAHNSTEAYFWVTLTLSDDIGYDSQPITHLPKDLFVSELAVVDSAGQTTVVSENSEVVASISVTDTGSTVFQVGFLTPKVDSGSYAYALKMDPQFQTLAAGITDYAGRSLALTTFATTTTTDSSGQETYTYAGEVLGTGTLAVTIAADNPAPEISAIQAPAATSFGPNEDIIFTITLSDDAALADDYVVLPEMFYLFRDNTPAFAATEVNKIDQDVYAVSFLSGAQSLILQEYTFATTDAATSGIRDGLGKGLPSQKWFESTPTAFAVTNGLTFHGEYTKKVFAHHTAGRIFNLWVTATDLGSLTQAPTLDPSLFSLTAIAGPELGHTISPTQVTYLPDNSPNKDKGEHVFAVQFTSGSQTREYSLYQLRGTETRADGQNIATDILQLAFAVDAMAPRLYGSNDTPILGNAKSPMFLMTFNDDLGYYFSGNWDPKKHFTIKKLNAAGDAIETTLNAAGDAEEVTSLPAAVYFLKHTQNGLYHYRQTAQAVVIGHEVPYADDTERQQNLMTIRYGPTDGTIGFHLADFGNLTLNDSLDPPVAGESLSSRPIKTQDGSGIVTLKDAQTGWKVLVETPAFVLRSYMGQDAQGQSLFGVHQDYDMSLTLVYQTANDETLDLSLANFSAEPLSADTGQTRVALDYKNRTQNNSYTHLAVGKNDAATKAITFGFPDQTRDLALGNYRFKITGNATISGADEAYAVESFEITTVVPNPLKLDFAVSGFVQHLGYDTQTLRLESPLPSTALAQPVHRLYRELDLSELNTQTRPTVATGLTTQKNLSYHYALNYGHFLSELANRIITMGMFGDIPDINNDGAQDVALVLPEILATVTYDQQPMVVKSAVVIALDRLGATATLVSKEVNDFRIFRPIGQVNADAVEDYFVSGQSGSYILYGGQDWLVDGSILELPAKLTPDQGFRLTSPDQDPLAYRNNMLKVGNFFGGTQEITVLAAEVGFYAAPTERINEIISEGEVYLDRLEQQRILNMLGEKYNESGQDLFTFGETIINIGDINGDAINDIALSMIGDMGIRSDGQDVTEAFLILHGGVYWSNLNGEFPIIEHGLHISTRTFLQDKSAILANVKAEVGPGEQVGLQALGDINQDGYDDIGVIPSAGSDNAYVLFGSTYGVQYLDAFDNVKMDGLIDVQAALTSDNVHY